MSKNTNINYREYPEFNLLKLFNIVNDVNSIMQSIKGQMRLKTIVRRLYYTTYK